MNPLVSVVMPVYNSEQFLNHSIESVLKQSYKNIELIIIDDNSSDNSFHIAQKYSLSDKRIKLIHLPTNKGVSNARNIGIDNATGEYITFIDSDDVYDNDTILNISKRFNKSINLYVYSFRKVLLDCKTGKITKIKENKITENQIFTAQHNYFKFMFDPYFNPSSCNKLFSLKTIKKYDLHFPTSVHLLEDQCFNSSYSFYITGIQTFENVFYNYNIHENSSCRSKHDKAFLQSNLNELVNHYLSLLNKHLSENDSYNYLNIMIFTNRFIPIFRKYKKQVQGINELLPISHYKYCKKHLGKAYLSKYDYYFARSYFSPFYRYSFYIFISLFYYLSKAKTHLSYSFRKKENKNL